MTMKLDDVDIAAIDEYPADQSVKIRGPPGTGKSTQSFARLVRMVKSEGIGPEDIAVVSYRKSLVRDLLHRLEEIGVLESWDLNNPSEGRTEMMGTVHAIARRLLDGQADMVDREDRAAFCSEIGVEYQGKDSIGKLIFNVLDWLIANEYPPEDAARAPAYNKLCTKLGRRVEIDKIADRWLDYKIENRLWDFDGLLSYVDDHDINPDLHALVVDEMHDVYPVMHSVIRSWAEHIIDRGGTVIIAGDPDQVINEYQGADASYFEDFELPEIRLAKSYRVPKEHWELATSILSRTHDRPGVKPISSGSVTEVHSPELPSDRMNSPHELVANKSTMFLARTKAQCRDISRSLKDTGLLYDGSAGVPAWNRRNESYGESHTNHDRVAVYNALKSLESVNSNNIEQHDWKPDALSHSGTRTLYLRPSDAEKFVRKVPNEYLSKERDEVANNIWKKDDCVGIEALLRYTTKEFWNVFCTEKERLDSLLIDDELVEWVRPALEKNGRTINNPQRQFDIDIRTIHASKGTEAGRVVVYDGITSSIRESMLSSAESRANEHRVWFVALTRASEELVIAQDAFEYTDPILGDLL
jgi:DNA helicase-2/ATP-dependent DNA helicase PcrA